MALKKFCNKSGCKNLTETRYCHEHQQMEQQSPAERHRLYDKHRRDQKAKRFYNSVEWLLVRKQTLIRDHGICQDCLDNKQVTPADVVDHIKPIEHFWELRLTLSNLRSLCHMHHNRKTAEDKRKYAGYGS